MKVVCVKIGGSTVDAEGLLQELGLSLKALVDRGEFPVVIHGGGRDIARQLESMNKEFRFVEGHRVTDQETMKTVQMVLSGDVNKRIVNALLVCGVNALGVSGVDGNLFEARKLLIHGQDIGWVGEIARVNTALVEALEKNRIVPVISPVSRDAAGNIYNVNADLAAGECAIALKADHLIFISDVPGVRVDDQVRHEIGTAQIEKLITEGHITGGMIPKVRSAKEAVSRGVCRVHICSWHGAETLARELAVETSSGTVIY
jgi:acetylglutamate kinase